MGFEFRQEIRMRLENIEMVLKDIQETIQQADKDETKVESDQQVDQIDQAKPEDFQEGNRILLRSKDEEQM